MRHLYLCGDADRLWEALIWLGEIKHVKSRASRRFVAAAVLTVVAVTALSHYVMDNAISTTMSGLAGAVVFFIVWSLASIAEERSVCIGTGNVTAKGYTEATAYSAAREAITERGFSIVKSCKEADILVAVGGGGGRITSGNETKDISYVYVIITEWSTDKIIDAHAMKDNSNEIRVFIKENIGFGLDKYF